VVEQRRKQRFGVNKAKITTKNFLKSKTKCQNGTKEKNLTKLIVLKSQEGPSR
jgi:hypothetical protein